MKIQCKSFLILLIQCLSYSSTSDNLSECSFTELTKEWDNNPLILLSTLDGSLFGVEQATGVVRWKIKDEPIVKVPVDSSKSPVPIFLPDPKDGSLYVFGNNYNDALKKLPFTIPQLVASSPCRSSDGILYTGKKVDSWFSIDPKTGSKEEIVSFDKEEKTCPVTNSLGIFIGRTEYNIMMLDSKHKERKWNVTFFDYSASTLDSERFKDYELVHFTATSSGRTVSLNRRQGILLWDQDYGSPVIAMYIVESENLVAVPFTSVAEETMDNLVIHFSSSPKPIIETDDIKLYPTLYVGEHHHGMYALPSLVDENTITIRSVPTIPLLLEGPPSSLQSSLNLPEIPESERLTDWKMKYMDVAFQNYPKSTSQPIIILGHYKVPDYSKTVLQIGGNWFPQYIPMLGETIPPLTTSPMIEDFKKHSVGTQTEDRLLKLWDRILSGNFSCIMSTELLSLSLSAAKSWFYKPEHKTMKLTFIAFLCLVLSLLYYLLSQIREYQQVSHASDKQVSEGNKITTALPEHKGEGIIQIGKISFNTEEILGKGCEGTFVYKGSFDSRAVAVKRILPECFTFADREVDLLRESDEHPNVIRYFCTEQDKQFRYIALELCAATLQDFVDGKFPENKSVTEYDILYQATLGLEHLHSLDIVHRDIKPHNVLLSMPNIRGEIRVMISDFGLCKKLKVGKMSFSQCSGITGTDGWIAPEILSGENRTTCLVDIFSLGCVFYYVLTKGKHPFGDPLRRQANILSGDSKLTDLGGDVMLMQQSLVDAMINKEPSLRPPASAIVKHPIFWNNSSILSFFQDVSDRIEKEDQYSVVLQTLEQGSPLVVQGDWRNHIDEEVALDLRKFRNYTGTNIRDLLRALRNKKHHYRELSAQVQSRLGDLPEKFVDYWTHRFPLLLIHSWLAMQCVKDEPIFCNYYHKDFYFTNPIIKAWEESKKGVEEHVSCNVTYPNKIKNGSKSKAFKSFRKKTKNFVPDESVKVNEVDFDLLSQRSSTKEEYENKLKRLSLEGQDKSKNDTGTLNNPMYKYWTNVDNIKQEEQYYEKQLSSKNTEIVPFQDNVVNKSLLEKKTLENSVIANSKVAMKMSSAGEKQIWGEQMRGMKENGIKKAKKSKQKAFETPLQWELPPDVSKNG